MSNLTAFNQDGIEIYIDNTTGESFASISGYARMSGLAKQRISERSQKLNLKEAEVLTSKGLRTVRLIDENLIVEWLIDDNPELAKKMLKLGVRVFLHQLSGFTVTSSAVQYEIPTTYLEALKAFVAAEEEKERLLEQTKMLEADNEQLIEFKDSTYR